MVTMTTDKLPELARIYKEAHVAEFERLEPITRPDYPGRMQANADAAIEAGLRAVMAEVAAAPPREVVVDEAMVERAVRAMVSSWCYAKEGQPDWELHYKKHEHQYRIQARAALTAALTHPQGDDNGR